MSRGESRGKGGGGAQTWRELGQLLRLPGFRKLFLVRLLSQMSDGMFQVGLATLLFFSPQAMGTARAVAAGFAVMLAPFTIVGPFAGVLLDRISRRQILLWGNVIRAVLTLLMAVVLLLVWPVWSINVLGLLALSVNRFLLAGLSAGMPKIIADDFDSTLPGHDPALPGQVLLTANSLVPTIGAGAAFLGGAIGFVMPLFPITEHIRDATTLLLAAVTMVAASLAAANLRRWQLGPDLLPTTRLVDDLARVVTDLRLGARYLWRRVTPAQGLLITGVHRFLNGLVFISAILLARNTLGDGTGTGLGNFAIIMGLIGGGGAIAIVITPVLGRNLPGQTWVAIMLTLAAGAMLILTWAPTAVLVFGSALVLGVAAQGLKIAVDTIVQRDTVDHYRGRAFAFYDVIFNAAFVAAALLAGFVVPDSGWARPLYWALAICYLGAAAWQFFRAAREPSGAASIPIL